MNRVFHVALFLCLAVPRGLHAQSSPVDTLSGVVRDDRGAPAANATVIATALPTPRSETVQTDSAGAFRLVLQRGDAMGYLVVVRFPGFVDARRAVSMESIGAPISITLQRTASNTLQTVQVRANRARPPRNAGLGSDHGPRPLQQPVVGGVRGLLSPFDETSLERITSVIPSVFGPDLGAFGLGAEQTLVTINGATADAGAGLPLGIATTVQVNSMSGNGALGGAAGSNINISVPSGGAYHYSSTSLNLDGAPLRNAVGASMNAGFRSGVGVAGHGPIGNSRWRYNGGISGTIAASDNARLSVVTADAASLQALGLTGDAVSLVSNSLVARGLSFMPPNASAFTRAVSGLARFDRVSNGEPSDLRARQWSFTLRGDDSRTDPGVSPYASLTTGMSQSRSSGHIVAKISEYVGFQKSWLHESQLALLGTRSSRDPSDAGPRGQVRIGSLVDGDSTFRTLTFGGSGSDSDDNARSRIDLQTRLVRSWATGRMERLTLDFFSGGEVSSVARSTNAFGTAFFASVHDLDVGRPSHFSRNLSHVRDDLGFASAGSAVTGIMWPTPRSRMTAILRAEAEYARIGSDKQGATPSLSSFRSATASPRVNYIYYDGGRPKQGDPTRSNEFGIPVHEGPTWQHLEFVRFWSASVSRLGGSLQNSLGAESDGTARVIDCVGENVPLLAAASWYSMSGLPNACADGSTGSGTLTSTRTLAAPISPSSTWEASLARERRMPVIGGSLRVGLTYRITDDLPTLVDANSVTTARFIDADGRANLVLPESIDPRSGSIPLSASRIDPSRGRQLMVGSDGEQRYSRLSFDYVPEYSLSRRLRGTLQLSYAMQRGSRTGDGVSHLSAAHAAELQRTILSVPTHQLSLRVARQFGPVAMSGLVFVSSGFGFTPLVDADVNGDGWTNDLAYTSDTQARLAVQELRSQVPRGLRGCLDEVLSSTTRVNSCSSPWSARTALSVFYLKALPIGERAAHLSMTLSNPLAMADQLLHGSGNMRGWGSTAVPDPYLLSIRSFDATTKQFSYAVNSRFGQSAPRRSAQWSPFRITISAKIDLADPLPVQEVRDFVSVRRKGIREIAPVSVVAERLRDQHSIVSPWLGVLARLDSLKLDDQQFRAARENHEKFLTITDSVVTALAREMTVSGARGTALIQRRDAEVMRFRQLYKAEARRIGELLRAEQLSRLSESLQVEIRAALSPP